MSAQVVSIQRHDARPPRAVQIPETLTDDDIDHTLYEFGFEFFGPSVGTQRLVHISDDCIDEYGDAADVMRAAEACLALFDRDRNEWVPLLPGDWAVEPNDDRGNGFIRMTVNEFNDTYSVVDGSGA